MTKKRVRKKPDIVVSKGKTGAVIDYAQDDVVISLVEKEDALTVKQPFSEPQILMDGTPQEYMPEQEVKDLLETHRRIDAEPVAPKIEPSYRVPVEVEQAILELPAPLSMPTQREYGEEFLPVYVKTWNKLRRLVGLK